MWFVCKSTYEVKYEGRRLLVNASSKYQWKKSMHYPLLNYMRIMCKCMYIVKCEKERLLANISSKCQWKVIVKYDMQLVI